MHRATYHFIRALGVPSMVKIKGKLSQRMGEVRNRGESNDNNNKDDDEDVARKGEVENRGEPGSGGDNNNNNDDDDDDDNDDVDIDVSMAIEVDANDTEAMAAITVVDYDSGDTLGKLMAFVNQLQMSSEVTQEYLIRSVSCKMSNQLSFVFGSEHDGAASRTVWSQPSLFKR